jgi:hypothetical protein
LWILFFSSFKTHIYNLSTIIRTIKTTFSALNLFIPSAIPSNTYPTIRTSIISSLSPKISSKPTEALTISPSIVLSSSPIIIIKPSSLSSLVPLFTIRSSFQPVPVAVYLQPSGRPIESKSTVIPTLTAYPSSKQYYPVYFEAKQVLYLNIFFIRYIVYYRYYIM